MRKALAFPVLLLVGIAATGWMYLYNPAVPGPKIGLALPLDELSHHSSVSLLWYLLVWGIAATLLGFYARWARIERLTAALILGLGVGIWSYLQVGISIAVVRQVPVRAALDTADRLQLVYLSAAAAAVGAAALARARPDRRTPLVVATVVALGGLLNLVHGVLPGRNAGLLHSITPDAVGPLANAFGVFAAVAMLVASRGLARRRHRAWQVATAVTGISTAIHVLHGFNHGTLASAVVLVLLIARRHDFDRPGDADALGLVIRRAVTAVVVIAAYALIALWVNRTAADQPLTLRFALRETLDGVFALNVRGSPHLVGAFGDWFPLSVLLLGIASTLWVVACWIAPWRHRVVQEEHERAMARALVHAWGVDTLAPFVLRSDKSYFFTPDEAAFLAYRVVSGVAIVSGDPIGPRNGSTS